MNPPSTLESFAARLSARIAQWADDTNDATANWHWPDTEFEALAQELFALQVARNPIYGGFVARNFARTGIERRPALPLGAFKEFDVTSIAPADRLARFESSGTSRRSVSRHHHSGLSLGLYEESLTAVFRARFRALIAENLEVIFLAPPPSAAPQSSLVHMFATLNDQLFNRRATFDARTDAGHGWLLELETLLSRLETLSQSSRPVFIAGTAFSFVHLLDAPDIRGRQFPLPPGSMLMETGGYKGRSREVPKDELHALLRRCFGVPRSAIVSEYGMSELSSQAYDSMDSGGGPRVFRFPPWCRATVVSPETGEPAPVDETGLLRIEDLANVWSAAFVQTEDLARRVGDGFELAGRAPQAEAKGCSLLPAG